MSKESEHAQPDAQSADGRSDITAQTVSLRPPMGALPPNDAVQDSFEGMLADVLSSIEGAPPTTVGTVLAKSYELTESIGQGGMGQVFLARHQRTGGRLAVKVVLTQQLSNPTAALRFELEARHTASLNHPNIVRVFDYGQDDALLYLVMEYVPGPPLQAVLNDIGAMPWTRAVPILEQVLM
ncbi:MAG: protein kinase, partial [Myxococcota bacterium]